MKLREDVQTVNFFLAEWEAAVQEQSAISINNSHAKKKRIDLRSCIKNNHSLFKDYPLGKENKKYVVSLIPSVSYKIITQD